LTRSGIASTAKEGLDGDKERDDDFEHEASCFNTPQSSFAGPTLRNRKLLISSCHPLLSTDRTSNGRISKFGLQ
jgi:hypothetical protein